MADESSSQLIALTSHFAQVQFRLKQILASPRDQREDLLDELGRFAFKGCPGKLTYDTAAEGEKGSTEQQRDQLSKLTSQLQDQLAELEEEDEEEVLYDGDTSSRSPLLVRKQDAALQEIKRKFDLEFPNLESLSVEEVKEKVGQAIDEVAQPTQSKNLTVRYLAQQVRSMEQHISLLQEELAQFSATSPVLPEYSSGGTREVQVRYSVQWGQDLEEADEEDHLLALHQYSSDESVVDQSSPSRSRNMSSREQHGVFVLRKTIALMQILTLWQCGGSFKCLPKPVTDNTKFQASVRALELAVDKISVIMGTLSQPNQSQLTISHLEVDLHEAVSMQLADSLRELVEHGLESVVSTESLSCFSPFSWLVSQGKHAVGDCPAWQVLKHFYQLKKGPVVCSKPENKLISSFCLPMETSASIKKTFLNTIHSVEGSFATCRNYSPDIKFRALICQGFNLQHLSDWFRQLATHPSLVDELYRPTAFMAATGFKPALQCMDKLRTTPVVIQVNLPASYYHHVNTFNH